MLTDRRSQTVRHLAVFCHIKLNTFSVAVGSDDDYRPQDLTFPFLIDRRRRFTVEPNQASLGGPGASLPPFLTASLAVIGPVLAYENTVTQVWGSSHSAGDRGEIHASNR